MPLVTALVKLPGIDTQDHTENPVDLHYAVTVTSTATDLESEIGANFLGTGFKANILFIGAEASETDHVRYTMDGRVVPDAGSVPPKGFIVPTLPSYVEIPVQGRLDLVQLVSSGENLVVQIIVQQ